MEENLTYPTLTKFESATSSLICGLTTPISSVSLELQGTGPEVSNITLVPTSLTSFTSFSHFLFFVADPWSELLKCM